MRDIVASFTKISWVNEFCQSIPPLLTRNNLNREGNCWKVDSFLRTRVVLNFRTANNLLTVVGYSDEISHCSCYHQNLQILIDTLHHSVLAKIPGSGLSSESSSSPIVISSSLRTPDSWGARPRRGNGQDLGELGALLVKLMLPPRNLT